mmetsp:Transcript_49127/g.107025  ORF Transcript_49127/g.107025 Transcript_49127/m.107025 type:complete len:247 (-) Transcript_49127:142-882(-)
MVVASATSRNVTGSAFSKRALFPSLYKKFFCMLLHTILSTMGSCLVSRVKASLSLYAGHRLTPAPTGVFLPSCPRYVIICPLPAEIPAMPMKPAFGYRWATASTIKRVSSGFPMRLKLGVFNDEPHPRLLKTQARQPYCGTSRTKCQDSGPEPVTVWSTMRIGASGDKLLVTSSSAHSMEISAPSGVGTGCFSYLAKRERSTDLTQKKPIFTIPGANHPGGVYARLPPMRRWVSAKMAATFASDFT